MCLSPTFSTGRQQNRAALALGDAHLDDRTPGKPHTLYVLLHGIVQHTLYHAGQIALLKRAVGGGSGG